MEEMPAVLKKLGKQDFALIDAFKDQTHATFEQDWGDRHWFCLDYMFLSNVLYAKIENRHGGLNEFPTALAVSDHAPLVVGLNIADLLKQK